MNSIEAARVLAKFHGAYPRVEIDDAVAATWMNTLGTGDYGWAMSTADEWINTETWWPTVAEFNGLMRRLRQGAANDGDERVLPAHSRIRCNGTGWINRGAGNEPCPACNPWQRQLWVDGDLDSRKRPPSDWIQPPRCRPDHSGEGSICTKEQAMAAVLRGLREHYTDIGLTADEIDARISRRMPNMLSVGMVDV
jgi:hypothetical protein